MRWQRIARLAIAVFVVVFATGVTLALLRRPGKSAVKPETPRVDQKSLAEMGAFTHTITDDAGKVRYKIDAQRMLTYADGRRILHEADVTLPDKDGRTMKLHGGEME